MASVVGEEEFFQVEGLFAGHKETRGMNLLAACMQSPWQLLYAYLLVQGKGEQTLWPERPVVVSCPSNDFLL